MTFDAYDALKIYRFPGGQLQQRNLQLVHSTNFLGSQLDGKELPQTNHFVPLAVP